MVKKLAITRVQGPRGLDASLRPFTTFTLASRTLFFTIFHLFTFFQFPLPSSSRGLLYPFCSILTHIVFAENTFRPSLEHFRHSIRPKALLWVKLSTDNESYVTRRVIRKEDAYTRWDNSKGGYPSTGNLALLNFSSFLFTLEIIL